MIKRPFRDSLSGIWKSPAFIRLWTASAFSAGGDQITKLAIPIIAVSELNAGPFQVGLLLTVEQLPQLLFTLLAGAWIDRLPKRLILVTCDIGRAAVLLFIPIAAWAGVLSMFTLFVVGFLAGIFTTWHMIAWQSTLPLISTGEELLAGTSAISQIEALAEVGGPVAGGGLVQFVGGPAAILIDALSFAGSAALVNQIRVEESVPARTSSRILEDIREGFRYLFRDPVLRAIGMSGGISVLFFSIREPLVRVYLLDDKKLSPGQYGLVFSLAAAGYAIGSFLSGPASRRIGIGNAILWPNYAFLLTGIGIALAALVDWRSVPIIAAMIFLEGLVEPIRNINQLSLRLTLMPKAMRGRLTSVVRFMIRGAYPIGTLAGGVAGELLGVRNALWLAILAGPLGAALFLGSGIRKYRRLPDMRD